MNFNSLLARAAAQEERKNKRFTYTLQNGDTLEFVAIPDEQILAEVDALTNVTEHAASASIEAADHLIYRCCPELQNPELHAQLGVVEPWDVVKAIFSLAERNVMGGELLAFLGIDDMLSGAKNA